MSSPRVLAAAWILLGAAIAKNNGAYSRSALAAVVAAELLLGVAVISTANSALTRRTRGSGAAPDVQAGPHQMRGALAAMLGAGLAGAVAWEPAIYGSGPALWAARGLAAGAALMSLGLLGGLRKMRGRLFFALLLIALAAGVLLLRASPRPFIDVWASCSRQRTPCYTDATSMGPAGCRTLIL